MSTKTKTKAKAVKKKKMTPLMEQYFKLKAQHPDAILLYRVGDFYETFADDAKEVADILGIVLTSRNNGGSDIALAGFPHHSLDVYLPKLVRAGFRVALCEQLEKPSKEKKIVKRGVTDIVTPGLTIDETILDRKKNNYLASVHFNPKGDMGVAFIDISTGEFLVSEGSGDAMEKLLFSFQPSEVIFSKGHSKVFHKRFGEHFYTYPIEEWVYTYDYTREKLLDKFEVKNLKGFSVESQEMAQIAAGAALHYLDSTQNERTAHITSMSRIHTDSYVWLDRFTIRNLELVNSVHDSGVPLIKVLDATVSPMGARLLHKWVLLPLLQVDQIRSRQDAVAYYLKNVDAREASDDAIRQMGDIERIASKISMQKINPRELLQLKKALTHIEPLKKILDESQENHLVALGDQLHLCTYVKDLIEKAIVDDPPAVASKGGIFKDGYHEELDEITSTIRNSKELLAEIQVRESTATGIANLKIGFNNVFGYYLEVTNKYKNQGLIPDNWVRKQTLANAERYITDELKVLEAKILNAQEKVSGIENMLYESLIHDLQNYIDHLLSNARIVANVDCLMSFAKIAEKYKYTRPTVDDTTEIQIKNGRHPVIERQLPIDEPFVPNDIYLSNDDQQIIMITGPNMSGKSAILRQTALLCLMAQMGSYIPADSATMGIIDKVFTRVGASDNISSGESTFMLEMNETASIMNNISERSLIILDEIGRGTSTYDGISIAWSLAEYLHNNAQARPKTLFATHYHELNELANRYPRIKNFNVATEEIGNKVLFLRKLVEGGSHHSFGIHVAKMAGMPREIIVRASEILKDLESKSIDSDGMKDSGEIKDKLAQVNTQNIQLSIFDAVDETAGKLKTMLSELSINSMTPIECMMKLNELKQILEDED